MTSRSSANISLSLQVSTGNRSPVKKEKSGRPKPSSLKLNIGRNTLIGGLGPVQMLLRRSRMDPRGEVEREGGRRKRKREVARSAVPKLLTYWWRERRGAN